MTLTLREDGIYNHNGDLGRSFAQALQYAREHGKPITFDIGEGILVEVAADSDVELLTRAIRHASRAFRDEPISVGPYPEANFISALERLGDIRQQEIRDAATDKAGAHEVKERWQIRKEKLLGRAGVMDLQDPEGWRLLLETAQPEMRELYEGVEEWARLIQALLGEKSLAQAADETLPLSWFYSKSRALTESAVDELEKYWTHGAELRA